MQPKTYSLSETMSVGLDKAAVASCGDSEMAPQPLGIAQNGLENVGRPPYLRRFFGAYGFSPPERIERRIGTPMRPKVSRRPLTR